MASTVLAASASSAYVMGRSSLGGPTISQSPARRGESPPSGSCRVTRIRAMGLLFRRGLGAASARQWRSPGAASIEGKDDRGGVPPVGQVVGDTHEARCPIARRGRLGGEPDPNTPAKRCG